MPTSPPMPAACSNKLADTLDKVVSDPNTVENWINLLQFGFVCLGVPGELGGKRHGHQDKH